MLEGEKKIMKRSIQKKSTNRNKSRSGQKLLHFHQHTDLIGSILKVICAVVIVTFLFGGFYTSAHNNRTEDPVDFKYYKSITIESGDSLWSIAENYMTDDYGSITEYIEFLKEVNQIHGDRIQEGQSLIIAYNDTDFIK